LLSPCWRDAGLVAAIDAAAFSLSHLGLRALQDYCTKFGSLLGKVVAAETPYVATLNFLFTVVLSS
jgi:hypothetical protein